MPHKVGEWYRGNRIRTLASQGRRVVSRQPDSNPCLTRLSLLFFHRMKLRDKYTNGRRGRGGSCPHHLVSSDAHEYTVKNMLFYRGRYRRRENFAVKNLSSNVIEVIMTADKVIPNNLFVCANCKKFTSKNVACDQSQPSVWSALIGRPRRL